MKNWTKISSEQPPVGVSVLVAYRTKTQNLAYAVTERQRISQYIAPDAPKHDRYWIDGTRVEITANIEYWRYFKEVSELNNDKHLVILACGEDAHNKLLAGQELEFMDYMRKTFDTPEEKEAFIEGLNTEAGDGMCYCVVVKPEQYHLLKEFER